MGYRYIGSKDKLSEEIIEEIKRVNTDAERVVDLMAGTGLFSLALKEAGYKVTASDMMTYSYHHLNVLLKLKKEPKFERLVNEIDLEKFKNLSLFEATNYEGVLNYLNNLEPKKGYFWKEFSPEGNPTDTKKPRKYFTSPNAAKIDAIRAEIKRLKEEELINDIEHSLLVHDLIMAANDIANIAGTYGHYLSSFVSRAKDPIELYPHQFSEKGSVNGHKVYQGYAEDLAKDLEGDICYIDPPYIKRQYAANYHVLETIARGDEPKANGVSGLRPWRDQYSNFCSKVKIRGSIDEIFSNLKCSDILFSYSEDGLLEIDELMDFLGQYGDVSKSNITHKRFKSNDSSLSSNLTEYLIHISKN